MLHLSTKARGARVHLLTAIAFVLVAVFTAATAHAAQAAPVAQFNRFTWTYTTSLTTSQEANRYQVMVLQSTDAAQVPALKAANPNLKIFMYMGPLSSKAVDTGGWTTCTPYPTDDTNHPDWFILDQYGNRIQDRSYAGDYLMDVSNPAYQQACVAHAVSLAKQDGFDGIYFDDISASLSWLLPSGVTTPEFPTQASWQAGMYSFLSYAGPAIHSQGLLVIGNMGGTVITPGLWAQWNGPLDGGGDETFAQSNMTYYWNTYLANAVWSAANGKLAVFHTHDTTEPWNTFGLATMLLAAQGTESWSTSNANYLTDEEWYPEYDTAQGLGTPSGSYTKLANGVYARTFANGVVLVNPSSSTPSVNLGGGTFTGSGLTSVSSVTMTAKSALILLADAPTLAISATVPPSAPAYTTAPAISGSAVVGKTLTASTGTWSGYPAPTYAYQWDRCSTTSVSSCVPISGATAATYVVQTADVGQYLNVTVTGTNSAGSAQASSALTALVPTPAFALGVSPTSQTVTGGNSAVYKITVVGRNGFSGSVALSASNLPPGATATFSANPTKTTSTLTITTTRSSVGVWKFTLTGTSGSQIVRLGLGLTVN